MKKDSTCPCGAKNKDGSSKKFSECCELYLSGSELAPTPEALMRSRYTAFCVQNIDYLKDTTDPQTIQLFDMKSNAAWAKESKFLGLEIISSSEDGNKGTVEFKATYQTGDEPVQVHHEQSKFRKQAGQWFFKQGKQVQ